MSLLAAYAVPHPPLIVPSVGRGQEQEISDTIAAYSQVAKRIATHKPDVIVITSPHAPLYRDGFFISDTPTESGSLAQFGQPQESITVSIDLPFATELQQRLSYEGIPTAGAPRSQETIDHATFVPLYFIGQHVNLADASIVRIGLSGLSSEDHFRVGEAISATADMLQKRVVLVASGDLSHKLKPSGPYGFAPEGPQFDAAIVEIFENGAIDQLFTLNEELCNNAAECGLRSFEIMAGALEGKTFKAELLSYEGPFGVGYGVAAFEVESEHALSQEPSLVDPLVALARLTVETYTKTGKAPDIPSDLPAQYLTRQAGVFTSLHKQSELRGCIGTIGPVRSNIAEEVVANAIAAATQDPRFPPVQPEELDYLSYSVDVLGEPEPVHSLDQLDPKRYGVIVTSGWNRGLLLPDLEGVDTVADQVHIAKRKAGIFDDRPVQLERFEVIRHSAGGEARR